jgi:hypothetical protein
MAETATTARLNVGGVHFEVSRSLIAKHDSSMLARLVSDTWQADPEAIIFIDRDGETFRHCLAFLRYGRVSLPLTVARDAFLRDMDYYGIEVDASLIGVAGPVVQGATCVLNGRKQINMETIAMQDEIKGLQENLETLDRTTQAEIAGLRLRIASLDLTDELFARYSLDGSLTVVFPNDNASKGNFYQLAQTVSESQESFVEYLGKYGFGLTSMNRFASNVYGLKSNWSIVLNIAPPPSATLPARCPTNASTSDVSDITSMRSLDDVLTPRKRETPTASPGNTLGSVTERSTNNTSGASGPIMGQITRAAPGQMPFSD